MKAQMMKIFDKWLYTKVRHMWENKCEYEEPQNSWLKNNKQMAIGMGTTAMVERGNAEGQDRITFELTSAVGGRILNVRRYDDRKDRHDSQTYVIPSGEDVGSRVAKIINLELIK
jgi:hypothetical protein